MSRTSLLLGRHHGLEEKGEEMAREKKEEVPLLGEGCDTHREAALRECYNSLGTA